MTNVKKINLGFLLLYLGDALFTSFIVLYFRYLGYTNNELQILVALKPACMLIGNLVYGEISKTLKKNLLLLKIIGIINMLVVIAFALNSNYIGSIILMIIWAVHNGALFSILDGVALKVCDHENKKYGITRMFGSIGYALSLLAVGLISFYWSFDFHILFYISGALMGVSSIFFWLIRPFETEEEKKTDISFKTMFSRKGFVKYMIYYFLVIGIWKISDDYCSELFNTLGLTNGQWSLLYGGEVVVEIITLFLLEKLIKNPRILVYILIGSGIIMTVRTFLFAIPMNIVALVVITGFLRGLGWGMFLAAHMPIIRKILGEDIVTKGVTFLAVLSSIFTSVGNLFYLSLADEFSYAAVYIAFGIIQAAGVIVLVTIRHSKENDVIEIKKESGDENA